MLDEQNVRLLMIAALGGDTQAYKRFLKIVSEALRNYHKSRLARVGRDLSEAEDLVQETLLAIHSRRETYDKLQPISAWVYALAKYKFIDHLRKIGRAREVPIDLETQLTADDAHPRVETEIDVERLIQRLPLKWQNIVRLTKIEDVSIADAANRTGQSKSAVKVYTHRALRAMSALAHRERSNGNG